MTQPLILIAMCTLNGARWLPEQLASIAAQEHQNWALWISDDGSTDGTRALIEDFAARHGQAHDIRLLQGPRAGAAQNFLWLITHPDLPLGPASHLALCDQDDTWLPTKLTRAMAVLAAQSDSHLPLIYGAQSLHIDTKGRAIGHSRQPSRELSVRNAVVQNMVSGHSLVLNPAALALARQAGRHPGVAFQDWWLALLVIAAGGRAVVDRACVLHYRQHDSNVMGAPQGPLALIRRTRLLFGRRFQRWFAANLAALAASPVVLTPEAARIVQELGRPQGRLARLRTLRGLGIHRQTGFGTALLYLAAVLGRV